MDSAPVPLHLSTQRDLLAPGAAPRAQDAVTPPEVVDILETGEPTLRPTSFRRESWSTTVATIPGSAEAIAGFPATLDRAVVADRFERLWPGDIVGALIAVLAWGSEDADEEPAAMARGLAHDAAALSRLRTSVGTVRSAGAVAAFAYLTSAPGAVPGLDTTLVTMWLRIASSTGPGRPEEAAPVLDARMVEWFASPGIGIDVGGLRPADYRRFIDTLALWGRPYGLGAADVEERLAHAIRAEGTVPRPDGRQDAQ